MFSAEAICGVLQTFSAESLRGDLSMLSAEADWGDIRVDFPRDSNSSSKFRGRLGTPLDGVRSCLLLGRRFGALAGVLSGLYGNESSSSWEGLEERVEAEALIGFGGVTGGLDGGVEAGSVRFGVLFMIGDSFRLVGDFGLLA